jgi:hypothetical protein
MDKVIKFTATVFIVIFVVFISILAYNAFVENAYRQSLVSTYSYKCTISSDAVLTNVTLFIPVPVDNAGNSPMVERFSIREVNGLPPEWKTMLLGSNKGTMVKISTPVINPAQNGTMGKEYTIELTLRAPSPRLIDTRTPLVNDAMFRPVQDLRNADCRETTGGGTGKGTCYSYSSAVYADYSSSLDARVSIGSEVAGRNEWKIFEPAFNEYQTSISVLMTGDQHGWVIARGFMEVGVGSYDVPVIKK